MNWLQTGLGGLIGIVITALSVLVGKYLARRTTLDVKQIDDRAQLTKDLMAQVEALTQRVTKTESVCEKLRQRELTLTRLVTTIGAELIVLSAQVCEICVYVNGTAEIEKNVLFSRLDTIKEMISRIRGIIADDDAGVESKDGQ